ncbi:DUF4041 domain-containing protein [Lactiplantibacillus daowaiensis]|uniref:DUF4041 domain-containing protein n=1 Tax=Lactiplantibacillus daowaiensis TaxID=2559918 RepID=A0ABW1S2J0_9LACO
MAIGDIFHVNEFKAKIDELQKETIQLQAKKNNLETSNQHLQAKEADLETHNQQLQVEIKDLKSKADLKLSLKQMEPIELNKVIADKEKDIETKAQQVKASLQQINQLNAQIMQLKDKLNGIKADISQLSPELEMSAYGFYQPQYDFATSLGYKEKLQTIRDQQKAMIKAKHAVSFNSNWQVNGSDTEGRKMNRNNIKAILRSFNNECTDAINKVSYSNFERIQTRIERSFEQHNKMYRVVQIEMQRRYLQLKLQELHLAFEYRQKVQAEKEQLREERAREREEKALQREIKAQHKMIDKEINHYTKAIEELETRQVASENDQSLRKEIEALKAKLADYHTKKAAVDYRESNATAGYVYIISNIGSFGKNIYKIGVTRRLDPMDRINELGSASVPFKFDVHAIIFSENAYALESELHNRFAKDRINMVNNRKEYFHITIDAIETELKKYKNITVDFREVPEAEEYRESLALTKAE